MNRYIVTALSTLLTCVTPVMAEDSPLSSKNKPIQTAGVIDSSGINNKIKTTFKTDPAYRGWDYLVNMLKADRISDREINMVFKSKRMPRFGLITFKLKPRESRDIYQGFYKPKTLQIAKKFLKRYRSAFAEAERRFNVDRHVVGAIIYIETKCGQYTGNQMVLNRLARVASIAEPNNLQENYKSLSKEDPSVTMKAVEERGVYLEETFYPEIPALFEIAKRNKIDIFGIRGSRAGAFGLPQFLPTTYLRFGVDANKDGRVSLYNEADAIASTANFLTSYGWKDNSSVEEKKKVIWNYNHSDAYVDAVLKVSHLLAGK